MLHRYCLLKHVIEGNIEVMGRRGRRCKQLPDDLMEKRGCWKSKEGALDRTVWETRLGRRYGPVVRQTAERGATRKCIFKGNKEPTPVI